MSNSPPSVWLVARVQGAFKDTQYLLFGPADASPEPLTSEEAAQEFARTLELKDGQQRAVFKQIWLSEKVQDVKFVRTNGAPPSVRMVR